MLQCSFLPHYANEVRRLKTTKPYLFVLHEVSGEVFEGSFNQIQRFPEEVEVRNDDVFGVPRHVDHLASRRPVGSRRALGSVLGEAMAKEFVREMRFDEARFVLGHLGEAFDRALFKAVIFRTGTELQVRKTEIEALLEEEEEEESS